MSALPLFSLLSIISLCSSNLCCSFTVDRHLGLSDIFLEWCRNTTDFVRRSHIKNRNYFSWVWKLEGPGSEWQRQRPWESAFLLYLHEGRNTVSWHGRGWKGLKRTKVPPPTSALSQARRKPGQQALRSFKPSHNSVYILERTNSLYSRVVPACSQLCIMLPQTAV